MLFIKKLVVLVTVVLLSSLGSIYALGNEELTMDNTFKPAQIVKIDLASSSCIIQKGSSDKIEVHLEYTYPKENYTPLFNEVGNSLILTEKFRGITISGKSTWTITVPEDTKLDISIASGRVNISGITKGFKVGTASGSITTENTSGSIHLSSASGKITVYDQDGNANLSTASGKINLNSITGDMKINSASGSVIAENMVGDMAVSTASGKINIDSSEGAFNVNSASGNINMTNIYITGASTFNGASSDILVELSNGTNYDLSLNTASGNSVLDYKGQAVNGKFVFTAREDRGEIISMIPFDTETTFDKNGYTYMKKTFVKSGDTPQIEISTASGRAELK
ncbi:MAG: DUF4097 domain-containing protein [Spirochaetaceae bacterium]